MKRPVLFLLPTLILIGCGLDAFAQGTAFTYQGRLSENGNAANGTYDLRFTLYDPDGSPASDPLTNTAVAVSNGLFTTTLNFSTDELWTMLLDIAVRTNGSAGDFTVLEPRQALMPSPLALRALSLSGRVTHANLRGSYGLPLSFLNLNNQISGFFTGNGSNLTQVNAVTLDGLGSAAFWKTTGNSGTVPGTHFLGTTDDQPLQFKVAGRNALRLTLGPDDGHLGYSLNFLAGSRHVLSPFSRHSIIAAGDMNSIEGGNYVTISGGAGHTVESNAHYATISGGTLHTIAPDAHYSVIAGGEENTVAEGADYASIVGGLYNRIEARGGAVPGGGNNLVAGDYGFAAGLSAHANHPGAFVWSDAGLWLGTSAEPFTSTATNQFSVRATGGVRFETGGAGMTLDGQPVLSGPITTSQIADGAIIAAKLASNSVTAHAVAPNTLTADKFAKSVSGYAPNPLYVGHPSDPSAWFFGVQPLGSNHFVAASWNTNNIGEFFVFHLNGNLVRTIQPPEQVTRFSYSSLATIDGQYVAIGSSKDSNTTNSGKVFLFNDQGTLLRTFVDPVSSPSQTFGEALLSLGHDKILIASPVSSTNVGRGHIFDIAGNLITSITNPRSSSPSSFGWQWVRLGEDRLVVGDPFTTVGTYEAAGVIYIFDLAGTVLRTIPNPEPNTPGFFGFPLATFGTNRIVVGVSHADGPFENSGAVYIFDRDGTLIKKVTNPTPAPHDYFGGVLWQTEDRFAIARPNRLYFFDHNGGLQDTWSSQIPGDRSSFGQIGGALGGGKLAVSDGAWLALYSRSEYIPDLIAAGVAESTVNVDSLKDGTALAEIADDDGADSGLDADRLDGLDSSAFSPASHDHDATYWKLTGNTGTTPGAHFLGTGDNQPLEFKVNGQRALRLEPHVNGPNVIGGSNAVVAGVYSATISGGLRNSIGTNAHRGVIGGGANNNLGNNAFSATVAGGTLNTIGADSVYGSIGGGFSNEIGTNSLQTTIGGGQSNRAGSDADDCTIAGGIRNIIGTNSASSAIGGGSNNITAANSAFATIPGGERNFATNRAFAAGTRAKANHTGSFVWADSQNADFPSSGSDQFCIRAIGGVHLERNTSVYFGSEPAPYRQCLNLWSNQFGVGVQQSTLYSRSFADFSWHRGGTHNDARNNPGAGGTEMMRLDQNGNLRTLTGTIAALSDRNAKTNFAQVDSQAILNKVVALPIGTWNYKEHEPLQRHIGPTSQDFHAAFNVGLDEKSICTIDADGVALAAIQGLNKKLEEQLKAKDSEIAEMKRRLARLEALLNR